MYGNEDGNMYLPFYSEKRFMKGSLSLTDFISHQVKTVAA